MLYGSGFTQYSHAFVNGEEVDVEFVSNSALRILVPVETGDTVLVEQQTVKGKVLQRSNELTYPNTAIHEKSDDKPYEPARYIP